MFELKSVVPNTELKTYFVKGDEENILIGYEIDGDLEVGRVVIHGATFDASDDHIHEQYKLWMTRPERRVGQKVEIAGKNIEELIDDFEEIFVGAFILQKNWAVQPKDNPYEKAIEWLRTTDFYVAPASTHYHDSVPGGLLVHSLKVYNQMCDLITLPAFKDVKIAEATLVALMHDWCKIAYYEVYMKNVKDEKTGTWNKEPAYKVNQKGIPLGHGVTSMYLASRVLSLTVEQCLAIRYHMGRWDVSDPGINEMQKANAEYPMVYLIQFADQLACTEYVK